MASAPTQEAIQSPVIVNTNQPGMWPDPERGKFRFIGSATHQNHFLFPSDFAYDLPLAGVRRVLIQPRRLY